MYGVAVSGGVSGVRIEDVKLLGQRGVHMKTTRGRGGCKCRRSLCVFFRSSRSCTDGESAFTTKPWVAEGKDVTSLANSYLVEYCNNKDGTCSSSLCVFFRSSQKLLPHSVR